jgi:hypothetical protein
MDLRLEKVCMTRAGYEFFLTEWEDKITGILLDDLKAIWHDMEDKCHVSQTPQTVQAITLELAAKLRNQSYFTDVPVPSAVTRDLAFQNSAGGQMLWTDKLLPRDAKGEVRVPMMKYDYDASKHVLSIRDQCRLWTTTSYVVNYMMLAQAEVDSKGGLSSATAQRDEQIARDARLAAAAQRC